MLTSLPFRKALGLVSRGPGTSEETADIYRGVARTLLAPSAQQRARAIGISSASVGEGVTTVAGKLAMSAARMAESPILLVDCNLEHPELEDVFRLRPAAGLRDVLGGRTPLAECIRRTHVANVTVLGPGGRMRGSDRCDWQELLDAMTKQSSLILFDMPPVNELVSQSLPLADLDGLLLVVEAERSRRPAVQRAMSQLQRAGAKIEGVILNKRKTHVPNWLYNRI